MKMLIKPETPISEITELYPEAINYLVYEYDFYCANCFASQFETLEQGAFNHGITGKDFEKMLMELNKLLAKNTKN